MRVPRRSVALLATSLALSLTVLTGGVGAQTTSPPVGDPAGSEWLTYGGNLFNQRYSGLEQINTSNVANLKAAWTFHTDAMGPFTAFESVPIVAGGLLFLTGPQSQIWALDPKSGQEVWHYFPDYTNIGALPICCGQVNRGVAYGDGRVYLGTLDARLQALDAKSGTLLWSTQVDDPALGYSETMAPLFYNGMVVMGVSGAEYEIRGHVTAYDAANGSQLWRFYTIPAPGEFGGDTWPPGAYQHGGGSVWQTPALDPDLGLLYLTANNPSPDLDGSGRAGNNLFTDSILALDLKTGQRKWHFQEVHHDIWDYDAISPVVLFNTTMGGKPVKGLGEAGKTGWVYLLDRETGAPLVGVDERAVPQMAAQSTAPTQPFPAGDSFVAQACSETIGSYPTAPIFTPFQHDPILMCPGANGGSEWSPAAYSPQTNQMYVCGIQQPMTWTSQPEDIEPGTFRLGSAFIVPPGGHQSGTFTAMDVRTNRKAWQAQWDEPCVGGALATAGGLVFAGEGNGNFDAYDARSGQSLWQFQTGAGANGTPMTYSVDGQQYVAIASGGNVLLGFPRGDGLWVFSLNGTIGPAEAKPVSPVQPVAARAVDSVSAVDYAFVPGIFGVAVPPGTTITWTNTGQVTHTVTAVDNAWDSGDIAPGATFSHTFDTPGTYWYFCKPHPWMRGTILIDPNAPPPQGSAEAATDDGDGGSP